MGTTTLYVGKLYEQVSVGTQTTYKNYIHAGGRVVAIRETVNSGAPTTKYLHQDHLGSTDVITSSTGQVLERTSFDAFGTRRIATTWRDPVTAILGLYSTRGFTGHEQLDTVGLIHMNGRVYDPELGRFLSADPTVQAPGNAQSLNRYSYVYNNPLSYTDPSGYWGWNPFKAISNFVERVFDKVGDVIQKVGDVIQTVASNPVVQLVAAIVAAPYVGFYIGTTFGLSTAAGYAVSGFTAGFIASGGDARAGLIGAATALGFYGVGNLAQAGSWGGGQTALAHGVVGGASNVAGGGSFQDGFVSGGFTSLASPAIGTVPGGAVGRTMAAAVVGGTASELGGGKFANGASTFGFLRLFGEAADYYQGAVGHSANPLPGENRDPSDYLRDPITGRQPGSTWDQNIIGLNEPLNGSWSAPGNFFKQGGMLSRALNIVPGVNATAGLHDYWFNAPGHPEFTFVNNVGTMLPAAAISTGAAFGNLTQGWDSNPALTFYLTMPRD